MMIDKLTHMINNGLLFKVSLILLILGFSTIPLSKLSHIDSIIIKQLYIKKTQPTINLERFVENKEVGYLSAINWWPNNTILIPLLIFMLGWLIVAIKKTNHMLTASGMVIHKKSKTVMEDEHVLHKEWTKCLGEGIKIWLILSVVAFVYSYLEYYTESFLTLSHGIIDPLIWPDWTIGCLLSHCDKDTNALFNFYAFTIQGLIASSGLLMFCIAVSYGFFIYRHSHYGDEWYFIPNIKSQDKRKGFENFEEVSMLLLTIGLVSYTIVYFIILQNQYLSTEWATSLFSGEHPFLSFTKQADFSKIIVNLNDMSNAIALMLGFFTILIIVAVIPSVTLSFAALKSRDNYFALNGNNDPEKLKGMVFWPYKWIKLNILIIALSLSAFGLLIPSLAFYFVTAYLTALVSFVVLTINKTFKVESA